jgi:selenocysteine lyase/cysteine desulfurase
MTQPSSLSRRAFVAAASGLAAGVGQLASDRRSAVPATSADDPLGVRADFPVTADRIYLNAAYITPVPLPAVTAAVDFVRQKAIRPVPLGDMLAKTDQVRAQYARLVNADVDEIGFLFATSEGENVVANALDLGPGDNVVIDELHYEAEFVLYRHLEETKGITLRVARHRDGAVEARDLEPLVDRKTKLVSVAWISHQNGFRHAMRPIADLAHAHGAFFYADAIQAVGMVPIDVREAQVDACCAGTYKWLLGGFGVAPFFLRREMLDRIRLDRFGALHVEREEDGKFELFRTAKRFDYATLPFAEVYELGAGLAYLERIGVANIERHTVALAAAMHAGLTAQGKRMFTPAGNRSSIVTFWFEQDPARVKAAFDQAKVDLTVRDRQKQVRVSTALFTNAADVDRFLAIARTVA